MPMTIEIDEEEIATRIAGGEMIAGEILWHWAAAHVQDEEITHWAEATADEARRIDETSEHGFTTRLSALLRAIADRLDGGNAMKNKLGDLNDHLFAQLERMADEDMTAEQLEQEVKRADAIVAVADTIVRNADLRLKAAKLYAEHGDMVLPHLPVIGSGSKSE